jgi:hypothetical protein
MTVPKFAELNKMSDEDLIAAHDKIADLIQPGVSYYLDELARRGQTRLAEAMLQCTRRIERLTLVVTAASLLMMVAAVANVIVACLHR